MTTEASTHAASSAKFPATVLGGLVGIGGLVCCALASAEVGRGTDPVVRRYLRDMDENPSDEKSTSEEFRGAEQRLWRDNTGAYEVQGTLSIIYPDKVRLTKANGRTTTVAMRRLSPADQTYVRWVADRLVRNGVAVGNNPSSD